MAKPKKLKNSKIYEYLEMINIAEDAFADEKYNNMLSRMGARVYEDYIIDENSREDWKKKYDKAMKITRFITEKKDFPWEDASNVIFPMIAQTAVQFNSRTYPNIVQGHNIVKGKVIGKDDDNGTKAGKAERVGQHMSYQLLEEMDDWEEGTDNLLIHLPIIGTAFKKTWHNPYENKHVSKFYTAKDIVINMNARSFKNVRRITHVYELYKNEIEENIRMGMFIRWEYGEAEIRDENNTGVKTSDATGNTSDDLDAPHIFYEQHRYWDLDGDGYEEPYIITEHRDTRTVVRIIARYDHESIVVNKKGELAKINPIHYFTRFIFLPDPEGNIYGMGWGILLGHINEAMNSAINQLIDAATDQNAGGGFIDSAISIKKHKQGGSIRFQPGEHVFVNAKGDDLRKNIVKRQTSQPSDTLMKMITFFTEATEKFTSTSEVLSGKQTLANVPATTTMALIEQSLTLITAISKRIHRSLREEFKKIYRLNRKFLTEKQYFNVLDNPQAISREDYDVTSCDVVPVSDPNNMNDLQRKLKAEALLSMRGQGLNDAEINKFYVETLQIGDTERFLLEEGANTIDQKTQLEMQKQQLEEQKLAIEERKLALEEQKLPAEIEVLNQEAVKLQAESVRALADAESKEPGEQVGELKKELKSTGDNLKKSMDLIKRFKTMLVKSKGEKDGNERRLGAVAGKSNDTTVSKGSKET